MDGAEEAILDQKKSAVRSKTRDRPPQTERSRV